MKLLDKIKSYYKEHKRDIFNICKIVVLCISLLFMLFSCAVDVFAYDIPEHAPPTETNAVTLPENYNVIPVGTYTIRYNELDFDTYSLSPGSYTFRCLCSFGGTSSSKSNGTTYTFLSNVETTYVSFSSIGNTLNFLSPTAFGYCYQQSRYGWNYLLVNFLASYDPASDILNLSYAPINFYPLISVLSEQNVGYEFGAFFHNNFMLVDNSSTGECPTIEELLSDYPDEDMPDLLASTKPVWYANNNALYEDIGYDFGFSDGYYEGSSDTEQQLSGSFLGNLVGGFLDALDEFVIFTDGTVTITMLTAIRSVFAALFVMWILKLIAGG